MTNMLSLNIRHSLAYSSTNHIAAIALENSINQFCSTFGMTVRTLLLHENVIRTID